MVAGTSSVMDALAFGAYNNLMPQPLRTEFDWLSRDEQEVDSYIAQGQGRWHVNLRLIRNKYGRVRASNEPQVLGRLPTEIADSERPTSTRCHPTRYRATPESHISQLYHPHFMEHSDPNYVLFWT